ncbi:unnamed protein product [Strongylus vulgaris]|uniref:Uncharacterized protein n=1 Tax=Strongylus vulgaris TaxID=40348 RepID=A0A3P7LXZ1_STRVU|nr:unnamed protein product [Strongylus vulgaris]
MYKMSWDCELERAAEGYLVNSGKKITEEELAAIPQVANYDARYVLTFIDKEKF